MGKLWGNAWHQQTFMSNDKEEISDILKYRKRYSLSVKLKRVAWGVVWNLLIRPLPRFGFYWWIIPIYRLFGAKIARHCKIHPSVRVFMPWNLEMDSCSTIGGKCNVYNTAKITIGDSCVVSEGSYLCTTSHNIYSSQHEQIDKSIRIGNRAWIATQAFIGMGVTIGEGAVVGARGCVFKDVAPWTVVGGNPAKEINKRVIRNNA